MLRHLALLLTLSTSALAADNQVPGPPPGGPEACALVSRDELIAAVGRKDFGKPKKKDNGQACFYSSSSGSITVTFAAVTPEQYRSFVKLLKDEGKTIDPVSGIGDEAFYWDSRIYVRVGQRQVTVHLSANAMRPQSTEAMRAATTNVARVAIAKLK